MAKSRSRRIIIELYEKAAKSNEEFNVKKVYKELGYEDPSFIYRVLREEGLLV